MGIGLGSQFDVNVSLPLDNRMVVATTVARDAIASGVRYQGMKVFVTAAQKTFVLKSGITNTDWKEDGGAGVLVVADITARNAIVAGDRYEGMIVYVVSEKKNYQLQGGILDANWKNIGAGGFKPLASVSATTVLTVDDGGALVTTTAGAVTITLPAVAGLEEGVVYVVKKISNDLFTVTVVGAAGTETFDSTGTSDVLREYLESQMYMLEAGNWVRITPVGGSSSGGLGKATVINGSIAFTSLQSGVKLADAATASIVITLPDAAAAVDKIFTFKKIDSSTNTVTIDGNGTQTIDGQLTYVLYDQYATAMIIANGGTWYRIG